MADWGKANIQLRADRDAMNDVKRRIERIVAAAADCGCTPGHVCRQNGACPRLKLALRQST